MEYAILIAPAAAVLALAFALFFARRVLKMPEDEGAGRVAAIIRRGANAFLKRQYLVVAVFFACMFLVLGALALAGFVGPFMPFAFVTGGVFSGLSGFLGMKIATAANARTATACKDSLNKGLRAAFSAGSVMGLVVVGLGLADMSIWFFVLKGFYGVMESGLTEAQFIATNMVIDYLGLEEINGCIRAMGFAHTVLHNPLHFDRYDKLGTTTPRDYASLFGQLARGTLVSRAASAEMLSIFRSQHYNAMLTAGFPPYYLDCEETGDPELIWVASKSGSMDACRNDGGIVHTPYGEYVIVLMNKNFNDIIEYNAHPAMVYGARVSRMILDQVLACEGRLWLTDAE